MRTLTFHHIVAHGLNYVIGAEGKMPWHLPEDLKHFRELTSHHIVIMGRKTFESIGKPLPNRLNIVISRTMESATDQPNLVIVRDWAEASAVAARSDNWPSTVFVIGGGALYRETLALITTSHVTVVPLQPEGDTFYCDLSQHGFSCIAEKSAASAPLSFQTWQKSLPLQP